MAKKLLEVVTKILTVTVSFYLAWQCYRILDKGWGDWFYLMSLIIFIIWTVVAGVILILAKGR